MPLFWLNDNCSEFSQNYYKYSEKLPLFYLNQKRLKNDEILLKTDILYKIGEKKKNEKFKTINLSSLSLNNGKFSE